VELMFEQTETQLLGTAYGLFTGKAYLSDLYTLLVSTAKRWRSDVTNPDDFIYIMRLVLSKPPMCMRRHENAILYANEMIR
jgi:hypothetical protein